MNVTKVQSYEDFVSNKRRFNSVALNSDNDDNDERETKKCRLSSSPNNKRKNSYNEDKAAPAAKRHAYYFTLAPADDKDVVDQGWSESEYDSFHDRETDLCKDSDDSDDDDESISGGVIEYDVASTSNSDSSMYSYDSSSGTEDIVLAAVAAHALFQSSKAQQYAPDHPKFGDSSSSSEFAIFADTESSDENSPDDPELKRADYWECVKCKNKQNNPMYRYCEKCYQLRKNYFPPRPKSMNGRARMNRRRAERERGRTNSSGISSSNSNSTEDLTGIIHPVAKESVGEIVEGKQPAIAVPPSSNDDDTDECGDNDGDIDNAEEKSGEVVDGNLVKEEDGKIRTSSGENKESINPRAPFSKRGVVGHLFIQEAVEEVIWVERANNKVALDSLSQTTDSGNSSYANEFQSPSLLQASRSGLPFISSQLCESNNLVREHCEERSFSDSETYRRSTRAVKIGTKTSDHQASLAPDPKNLDDLCILCLDAPKNSAFVHTQSLHMCCCYKCAVKVWHKQKRCPVCSSKIMKVLKLFVY